MQESHDDVMAHLDGLRSLCTSLTDDEQDAEDLVQEVLLAAFESSTRDPTRPVRPWLRQVARNVAWHWRRRKDRPKTSAKRSITRHSAELVEIAKDATAAWAALLSNASAQARTVLILRDLLDLSSAETAAIMGLTVSNVDVIAHRVRQRLRRLETTTPTRGQRIRAVANAFPSVSLGSRTPEELLFDGAVRTSEVHWSGTAISVVWSSLLDAAERLSSGNGPARLRVAISRIRTMEHHPDAELTAALDRARTIAATLDDPSGMAELDTLQATRLMERGRVAEAMQSLWSAAEVAPPAHPVRAAILIVLSRLHLLKGQWSSAVASLKGACEFSDHPEIRRVVRHNLAAAHASGGDRQRALATARASFATHNAQGRPRMASLALGTAAVALTHLGRLEESVAHIQRARTHARHARALREELIMDGHLAFVRLLRGELEVAAALAHEVTERSRAHGYPERRCTSLATRGVALRGLGDISGSYEALRQGYELARELRRTALVASVLPHLVVSAAMASEPFEDLAREALAVSAETDRALYVSAELLCHAARVQAGKADSYAPPADLEKLSSTNAYVRLALQTVTEPKPSHPTT